MDVSFERVGRFRRNAVLWRRGAWLFLVLSVVAVILWNSYGGPQPASFGYRFSPMYTFSLTGFLFWLFVLFVLIAVALINYLYVGLSVRLRCPSCNHTFPSKAEWVCGYCGTEHRPLYGGIKDSYFTLLTECKQCRRAPEAYKCPECGTVTAFTEGAEQGAFAYSRAEGEAGEA